MESLSIGNSALVTSRLCIGGCPMGGYGWGRVERGELIDAVRFAADAGVNFFDSADVYGLGEAERTLGEALEGIRDKVVVATKFGVRVGDGGTVYDNSPAWIRTAIDASLSRLKTDYIDLYQVHYLDGKTPLFEVVACLEELVRAGKIRYYGLSNITGADIGAIKKSGGNFVSFQDEYSLAQRKNEDDMKKIASSLPLTPMTWGSLGQGILTGKYGRGTVFERDDRRNREVYVNFYGEKLEKNLEIVDKLREIAQEEGRPVSAVALRFILDVFPGSVVLAGVKNTAQARDNIKALGWTLSDGRLKELERISKTVRWED